MVLPESHERYWILAWSPCLHRPKMTNESVFPDIPIRIIMMSIYTRKKSVNAFRADKKGSGGAQNVDVNSIAVILDTEETGFISLSSCRFFVHIGLLDLNFSSPL
jgi:hypothetical protein